MNIEFKLALIQLIIALAIGIITVFLTKKLVINQYLKNTKDLNPYKNTALMIFLSGTIFSVAYIVFGIMEPLSSTIKLLLAKDLSLSTLIVDVAKYLFLFLSLGYLFSGTIIFLAYKLFAILTTQVDEFKEIYENNIGVALLIAILTIVIALFTKNPFIILIESLIPFPEVPGII